MIPTLAEQRTVTIQPSSRTWQLDFDRQRLVGVCDGLASVAQAAYCALLTPRYAHIIYSWQYGAELHSLIGRDPDYVFSEAKRMIKDALSVDARITAVRDFRMQDGVIRFAIDTIYGSQEISVGVQP